MSKILDRKVLIEMATHFENTGSAMMVINTIHYLHKVNNSLRFYLGKADTSMIRYYRNNLNEEIYIEPYPFKVRKLNIFKNALFNKCINIPISALNRFYKKQSIRHHYFNLIIFLGGDNFSPVFRKELTGEWYKKNLQWVRERSCDGKCILLGQTIAPYPDQFEPTAFSILKEVTIFTRDQDTYNYLNCGLSVPNVKRGYDIAFADLPFQNSIDFVIDKYKLPNKYVVYAPSGFWSVYSGSRNEYFNFLSKIYNFLSEYCKKNNYKLVLLSHVLGPGKNTDDRVAISNIRPNDDTLVITKRRNPVDTRLILASAMFTVTGRMHAAVSSFQTGKPAISISYSKKYISVLGEFFGNELIVDGISGTSEQNVQEIVKSVSFLEENYDIVCETIQVKVNAMKESIVESINSILK